MDERFRAVYGDIYQARTSPDVQRGLRSVYARMSLGADDVNVVRAGIDQAEQISLSRGLRLREDAQALLAINFQEMVMLPLRSAGEVGPVEIAEAVTGDIRTLVELADPGRYEVDEPEISGHTIIEALSRSWPELRISRFGLWE